MHSDTELSLEDCFWHAFLIDIDLSHASKAIRLVTAPEVVPCHPDPRTLTEVSFHDVLEFTLRNDRSKQSIPTEGQRAWTIRSMRLTEHGDGTVVQILSNDAPNIEIKCAKLTCALLPIETRAELSINASEFIGRRHRK